MSGERKWYVIHTYSGYENKVKTDLERKINSVGLKDMVFNIVVPLADETEIKNGKRQIVKKKVFPGYVLVEMIVDSNSWYHIRNTPGVTGFVGTSTIPIPLTDAEVRRIFKTTGEKEIRPVIEVEAGQIVRINDGAFESFSATVTKVDRERGKIKATVDMFGRETTVELNLDQIEKI